ncbi:MAG: site-specific DNA-methyltransferase [bacterium]
MTQNNILNIAKNTEMINQKLMEGQEVIQEEDNSAIISKDLAKPGFTTNGNTFGREFRSNENVICKVEEDYNEDSDENQLLTLNDYEKYPATIEDLQKYIKNHEVMLETQKAFLKNIKSIKTAQLTYKAVLKKAQNVAILKLEAERKMGEILEENIQHQGGRPSKNGSGQGTVLKDYNISKKQSQGFQAVSKNPEVVEEVIDKAIKRGEIPLTKDVVKQVQKQKVAESRKKMAEEGEKIKLNSKDCKLIFGDFRDSDIEDNSVDLILTDPPYLEEFLPLYSELAKFAKKVLKPHGFLITYLGHIHLPEVLKRIEEQLDYYWQVCLKHSGNADIVFSRNMMCCYKPILVFQKGISKIDRPVMDMIHGTGREKDCHEWQQAEGELTPIIESFTKPCDLIVDPFSGSATTLIASYKLKRRAIGYEINKETFNIAKNRISAVFKENKSKKS